MVVLAETIEVLKAMRLFAVSIRVCVKPRLEVPPDCLIWNRRVQAVENPAGYPSVTIPRVL
jgi:hypothetical protein